jgi:hypothetical protein
LAIESFTNNLEVYFGENIPKFISGGKAIGAAAAKE